jgi:hypothetical protein
MDSGITQDRVLIQTLLDNFDWCRGAFGQSRVFWTACLLALGCLFAFCRKTVTQLLVALGQTSCDWTRWYRLLSRRRFDYDELCRLTFGLAHELFARSGSGADAVFAMAVDATHVTRSGKKFSGVHWAKAAGTPVFRPGIQLRQRFENSVALTPIEDGYSRAIPMEILAADPPKALAFGQDAARTEWEAGLQAIKNARHRLDGCGQQTRDLLVLGDGAYDVNGIWNALPAHTILMTRCSRNRRLHALPPERAKQPAPGAPLKYGQRCATPKQMRADNKHWAKVTLRVRGRDRESRHRVEGPFVLEGAADSPVYLILVGGMDRKVRGKRVRHEPTQYLVSARRATADGRWTLPLEVSTLLSWMWQRWEIEVCHREMKTTFGLGQMQCWSRMGSTRSVQFMGWAYAMFALTGLQVWNGVTSANCSAHPPGKWWAGSGRWSFNRLWHALRHAFWGVGNEFLPVCSASDSKPAKIDAHWPRALQNSAAASSRG